MIPVTKPFKPPIEEYQRLLKDVWERNWFTNNGPLLLDFESKMREYLSVENFNFVSNGTIAIQIALKALGITKKVITTPFSYVATTSSIVWEGCTPVFVDINPDTLNIDVDKIEEQIDENTQAILATHCFGNPCEIERIQQLAEKYNLKVIYDAAHCFGTRYNSKSIFEYGDICTTSFHATKLFHTIEGGGIFTKDSLLQRKVELMRNFGHDGPDKFNGVGINGKNSEVHAAMGLVNIPYIESILENRKSAYNQYLDLLKNQKIKTQKITDKTEYNYSYFPIIFETELKLLKVKDELEKEGVFGRRYFFPSLDSLDYVEGETPVSRAIARTILCLPMYYGLRSQDIERITKIILKHL